MSNVPVQWARTATWSRFLLCLYPMFPCPHALSVVEEALSYIFCTNSVSGPALY
jgi:hypothetical protein